MQGGKGAGVEGRGVARGEVIRAVHRALPVHATRGVTTPVCGRSDLSPKLTAGAGCGWELAGRAISKGRVVSSWLGPALSRLSSSLMLESSVSVRHPMSLCTGVRVKRAIIIGALTHLHHNERRDARQERPPVPPPELLG